MKTVLRLLEDSKKELEEFYKDYGGCDHPVGICWCGLKRLIEDISEKIESIKHDIDKTETIFAKPYFKDSIVAEKTLPSHLAPFDGYIEFVKGQMLLAARSKYSGLFEHRTPVVFNFSVKIQQTLTVKVTNITIRLDISVFSISDNKDENRKKILAISDETEG